MKNLQKIILSTALVLAIPTIALAIQTNTVDVTKNINKSTAEQIKEAGDTSILTGITALADRYTTNFRTCEPIHLKNSIDLFGLKINYQFDINGWINNKCSYYMTGSIDGLGNDIREVFNIKTTDETIAKIKPVIQCDFTKEQLNILVDGIIAAQERKLLETESKATSKSIKNKTKLSPEEEKLAEMLFSGNVCTIPNQEELMKNVSELFETSTPQTPTQNTVTPSTKQKEEQTAPIKEEISKPELRQNGPKVNMPSAPQY